MRGSRRRRARTAGAALGAVVLLVAALAFVSASGARVSSAATVADAVELLPLQTADRRIVDTAGRDVLLRGANVNVLGEYWQGVPSIPATIPLTEADWDLMASRGFSVIRLLVTWSRIEPQRGVIDQGYLDQVDAAVQEAAARGIYSVIDMHQDAFSAFISTTDPDVCPPGTSPAKGWDGAPAWATLTDGLSTCLPGSDRNSSPAVERAWNNFYDNTDGIRDRFVASWAAIADRFAGRPEVAGYDVLNEPENPRPAGQLQAVYDAFLADAILAIRAAEAGTPFDHIVFVEPALPSADFSRGIVIPSPAALGGDVANISGSVHNYMESIGNQLTLEQMNDLIESITAGLGVPNWGGEYGFWDTEPATLAKAGRYAADEDAHLWGGAWWQWRQSCGDPHSAQWSGSQVVSFTGVETHLNLLGCPDNVDLGPNDAFLDILGRGYPRAAPGRLVEVRSDPTTGALKVVATAPAAGGELVVWTPTANDASHQTSALGLTDVTELEVDGGRIITATVAAPGTYSLWIGEPDDPSATTTSSTTTSTTTTSTTTTTVEPTSTTAADPSTTTIAVTPPTSSGASTPGPVAVASIPAAAIRASPTFTG